MKNEKGYALLLVLIMMVMFTILGLSIIGVSLNSNLRTDVREDSTSNLLSAEVKLAEVTSLMEVFFRDKYTLEPAELDGEIVNFIEYFKEEDEFTSVKIEDITDDISYDEGTRCVPADMSSYKKNSLTRRFQINAKGSDDQGREREVEQTVYLTGMPSFLNYALGAGSDEDLVDNGVLNINGSPEITGNIFGKKINVDKDANKAYYTFNGVSKNVSVPLLPYLDGSIYLYEDTSDQLKDSFRGAPKSTAFLNPQFIDIDFEETFDQYSDGDSEVVMLETTNEEIEVEDGDNFIITNHLYSYGDNELLYLNDDLLMGASAYENSYFQNEGNLDLNLDDDQWLHVTGDLDIMHDATEPLIVKGKFLVEGNVIISGNIEFDGVIYTKGDAIFNQSNISSIDDTCSQLILLAREEIVISRVNEFTDDITQLKAFLYSEEDITLFGVGSRINIDGGVFSKKNIEINAVNGDVSRNDDNSDLEFIQNGLNSLEDENDPRFVINYNRRILTLHPQGIPVTKKLYLILDKPKVIK